MVILRLSAVPDHLRRLRIQRAGKLFIPVQFTAGVCHAVVDVSGSWNPFGDICRMRGDFGSDDSLLHIIHIRQRQMLRRRHVTQERRSVHGGYRPSDGSGNMVIPRRDIRHQWSQYIKWRSHADALLYLHVGSHLIQRHVARSFHHYLNIMVPCAFGQLAQAHQFFDLAYVRGVRQTSRTACIAQRNGHIVLFTDVQDLIKVFIKRVFLTGHAHPGKYQASAPADNIHLSLVFPDLIDGLSRNSAVQCNKINAVLCMKAHHIDKIFRRKRGQISLIMNYAVIDRNRTDHNRAFTGQFLTEGLRIAVAGQIHDGLRPQVHRAHYFFHLNIVVLAVSGHAQIHVDLGAEHTADPFRIQTGMALIGADYHFSFCHQLHQLFQRHLFLFRHNFHLFCGDPFPCRIHLCCILFHFHSPFR